MIDRTSSGPPPGKWWWIATAVCHVLNAFVFAGGVWACIHWLNRSETKEYYDTHRSADPDGMILLEFFMLGVTLAAVCAVAYAIVGASVTLGKYQAGPAMLWASFPVTGIAGALAIAELCRDNAALADDLSIGLLLLVMAGVGIGLMASSMRQRPKNQTAFVPPRPAPYTGGSPYQRPPGS